MHLCPPDRAFSNAELSFGKLVVVSQAGQWVEPRHVGDTHLRVPALGNIHEGERGDDAAHLIVSAALKTRWCRNIFENAVVFPSCVRKIAWRPRLPRAFAVGVYGRPYDLGESGRQSIIDVSADQLRSRPCPQDMSCGMAGGTDDPVICRDNDACEIVRDNLIKDHSRVTGLAL